MIPTMTLKGQIQGLRPVAPITPTTFQRSFSWYLGILTRTTRYKRNTRTASFICKSETFSLPECHVRFMFRIYHYLRTYGSYKFHTSRSSIIQDLAGWDILGERFVRCTESKYVVANGTLRQVISESDKFRRVHKIFYFFKLLSEI